MSTLEMDLNEEYSKEFWRTWNRHRLRKELRYWNIYLVLGGFISGLMVCLTAAAPINRLFLAILTAIISAITGAMTLRAYEKYEALKVISTKYRQQDLGAAPHYEDN